MEKEESQKGSDDTQKNNIDLKRTKILSKRPKTSKPKTVLKTQISLLENDLKREIPLPGNQRTSFENSKLPRIQKTSTNKNNLDKSSPVLEDKKNLLKDKREKRSKSSSNLPVVSLECLIEKYHPHWKFFRHVDQLDNGRENVKRHLVPKPTFVAPIASLTEEDLSSGNSMHISRAGFRKSENADTKTRYREASIPRSPEEQIIKMNQKRTSELKPSTDDLKMFSFYFKKGIRDDQMAQPDYNYLKLVSKNLTPELLRDIRFCLIVENLVKELHQYYLNGVRRAVLLYALLSLQERKSFSKLLFVKKELLQKSSEGNEDYFMSPEELEEKVRGICRQTRNILLNDCVRSKMSLQLRSLTIASLNEFLSILKVHEKGNFFEGEYDESKFFEAPLSTLVLKVENNELVFKPSLEKTRECLKNCVVAIIDANRKIPRMERLLFPVPWFSIGKSLHILQFYNCKLQILHILQFINPFYSDLKLTNHYLHPVNLKEEIVQNINSEIEEIFDRNFEGPKIYIEIYVPFEKLFKKELRKYIQDFIKEAGEIRHGRIPVDQMPFMGRMYAWPQKIQEDFRLAEVRLSHKRDQKEAALKERVRSFDKTLTVHSKELEDLRSRENFSMKEIRMETMKRNVDFLDKLSHQLHKAKTELQAINEEQNLLSWEISKFPLLQQILIQKEPFDKLWHTTHDFHLKYELWYNGPFLKLDADVVNEEVEGMWKTMFRLTKTFSDQVGSRRVAEYVKEKIEVFRQYVPILQCICNPGLRERHWKLLGEHLGTPIELTESTSLGDMIEAGLPSIQRKLEEISHSASKEFALEKSLEKMKSEWVNVTFEFKAWRETGVSILSAVDDIQVLLDEHTQKVQTMRGSPYIKPFEEEIKAWEEKLLSMQDILDSWVKCQVTWLYLEPIFSSEDIMKQMPVEGRKFSRVDSTWRDIMSVAVVDPRALVATDQPNMLERLQENNALLEDIQKGLNNYLEKKRLFFPRFFFLSNDELLEILSETKDPQRVQPHLRKCFQGIDALNFSSLLEIEGMISSDGEMVQFSNRVIPGKARGLVEKWLLEVEEMMIQSLQDVMVRAMESYPQTPHQKWIIQWPSQIVLTVVQILWTSDISSKLLDGGLQDYIREIDERIEEVVRLVKGELKPADRITLGNLIISYVHGRDVAKELKSKNVQSLQDFSWVSQLRYLWINELVQVHMIMTSIDYGYEYLGNTTRLVITPLTDRCFRTLMGALKHHLGGAPEGPAGTGKTETCKDLAKAVAKQCIIFNCSEGMDYKAMAKFLKGLAQSGSWACFDEFNRMELEVLSVVAQQVQCLQSAVVRGAQTFSFDGTTLVLNPSCNVFITMNPGLARKIIDTYKLCSEQLSSQSHYDYGMRAVKAVLLAASSLKLQCPSLPEVQIVLKAIKDVNLPKFLSQDVPLFEGIVNDLFPAQYSQRDEEIVFEECIKETFANKNLQNVDWLTGKIMQLYNMILVRHGVMIVGDSLSGKTTAYQVLCSVIETLSVSGKLPNESGVQYKIINPKALTLGQLYGAYDPFSHEWSDGVLAKTFREMAVTKSEDRQWLIFDGPVDSLWVENLNTALDDNKKLCLMSGEIIQVLF
ncbi:Dynein heavy chain 3, axonemal [Armadillidium nasatum]|uniref:Dynein heavy chain 3, axonemal n=1 Tax=Armadillidium nasatum TaxID=96803 RepID=A0A5N5SR72_9CRUS|nr:Dynein heavy chain 3, axonemal [Armadillidium nasatum]